jgi:hypothetical protein
LSAHFLLDQIWTLNLPEHFFDVHLADHMLMRETEIRAATVSTRIGTSRDNWTALSYDESASPTLKFNCKNVPENDVLVMQLVASRKDERQRIVSRDRPKLAEEFRFMGDLSLIFPAELDPSAGVMPESA